MKPDTLPKKFLLLGAIALLSLHPAVAQTAKPLLHYPLDGSLNAKGRGSPLMPPRDTEVFYASDSPTGKGKSVLFGKDPNTETQRLLMPEDFTLPVVAGAISFWVKAPEIDTNQSTAFILHAPGFDQNGITSGCYITVNGPEESIAWQFAGGGRELDSLADLSEWTHVVLTWNESQNVARLYINGKESGKLTIPQGPELDTTHRLRMGGFANRPEDDPKNYQFSGMLSDLRIYDEDITEEEIATLSKP